MPITFARIRTSPGKPKPATLKVLIDTSASKTIVKYQHTCKLKHSKDYEEKQTHFETTVGTFSTHAKAKIQFSLNEFFKKRLIEHVAHVAKDLSNYDMIISRDLLHELGIDVKFSTKTIEWDGVSIPMKSVDATKEDSICQLEDPPFNTAETERVKTILDAKYEKANLEEVIAACKHLSEQEQASLLELLNKYEDLFDSTLEHLGQRRLQC
jgi:hypothetical protein